jgi:hypothetical protein
MENSQRATVAMACNNLVNVSIGEALPGEITPDKAKAMGISEWRLSDVAVQEIQSIESNIRAAEHESGNLLLG